MQRWARQCRGQCQRQYQCQRLSQRLGQRRRRFHSPNVTCSCAIVCSHYAPPVDSAGRESRRGGDGYDFRSRERTGEFVIVQYTLAGCGELFWGGKILQVPPGSAMFVSIPHDHRYRVPLDGTWDFVWMCLLGQDPREAWRAFQTRLGPVIDLTARPSLSTLLCSSVNEVLREPSLTAHRASALACSLSMAVADLAAGVTVTSLQATNLETAAQYCRDHATEELTIEALAAVAGLSRPHFTRSFTAAFGIGPKEFLTDLRLQHACELLRQGGLVAEVGYASGFHDPTYFCRVFRQGLGMSPGEFHDGGMFQHEHTRAL